VSDPFLGEIRLFPYTFEPRGWAFCNGQILSISQNTALFALIGTIYGGDGRTTFALPDLRGRVAVSAGAGPGLSTYEIGQVGGEESVSLSEAQMPAHKHRMAVNGPSSGSNNPNNRYLGRVSDGTAYAGTSNGRMLNPGAIAPSGGSQPHENRPPHLTLNYCIALEGIFPSRD
jgi:microcystin-dependent protein